MPRARNQLEDCELQDHYKLQEEKSEIDVQSLRNDHEAVLQRSSRYKQGAAASIAGSLLPLGLGIAELATKPDVLFFGTVQAGRIAAPVAIVAGVAGVAIGAAALLYDTKVRQVQLADIREKSDDVESRLDSLEQKVKKLPTKDQIIQMIQEQMKSQQRDGGEDFSYRLGGRNHHTMFGNSHHARDGEDWVEVAIEESKVPAAQQQKPGKARYVG